MLRTRASRALHAWTSRNWSASAPGTVIGVHVCPPSVVRTTVPPVPASHTVSASTACAEMRRASVPESCGARAGVAAAGAEASGVAAQPARGRARTETRGEGEKERGAWVGVGGRRYVTARPACLPRRRQRRPLPCLRRYAFTARIQSAEPRRRVRDRPVRRGGRLREQAPQSGRDVRRRALPGLARAHGRAGPPPHRPQGRPRGHRQAAGRRGERDRPGRRPAAHRGPPGASGGGAGRRRRGPRAPSTASRITCRREIAEWIGEAKRDATRQRRLEETMEALAEGRSPR